MNMLKCNIEFISEIAAKWWSNYLPVVWIWAQWLFLAGALFQTTSCEVSSLFLSHLMFNCFLLFVFYFWVFRFLISFRQKSDVLSKGDVEDIDEELEKLDLLYVSTTTNILWYVFLLLRWHYALKLISAVNLEATNTICFTPKSAVHLTVSKSYIYVHVYSIYLCIMYLYICIMPFNEEFQLKQQSLDPYALWE